MIVIFLILSGLFLAYANGANDNFKGVATLFGSQTTDYKKALIWATMTTLLGSLMALFFAKGLIASFSGKGLVPDSVVAMKSFPVSVLFGAALTVMLATRFGFPISTTHALTGALVGVGFLASQQGVNLAKLGQNFFLPLIVSPVIAIVSAGFIYPIFRFLRIQTGIKKESCLCVGTKILGPIPLGMGPEQALTLIQTQGLMEIEVGAKPSCVDNYSGSVVGIDSKLILDSLHYLSSGAVSFARGLNDTPKIAAMLLTASVLGPSSTIIGVTGIMAVGGILNARKVAETMSHRVTQMNAGQGFTANLVTSIIVIFASKIGVPVSTTHVSCGALFGLGAVTGQAHYKTILGIFAAWIITLPVAGILGALTFFTIRGFVS